MTESWQESAYHERFKTRSEQDQLFKARPTPNSRLQIRSKRGPPFKARPWMIVRRRSFRRRRNEPHDHFVAGETSLTIISSPAKRASRSFRRRRNEALTKLGLTIIHVKAPSRSRRSRRLGQHTRSLRKELFIPLHPQLVSSGDWARRPAAKQRLGQHTLPTPPTTTALRGPESAAPLHAHTRRPAELQYTAMFIPSHSALEAATPRRRHRRGTGVSRIAPAPALRQVEVPPPVPRQRDHLPSRQLF
jgi:hypothetical protein